MKQKFVNNAGDSKYLPELLRIPIIALLVMTIIVAVVEIISLAVAAIFG